MIFETTTTLSAAEIFSRARRFFAERVPQSAAFPEKTGPGYMLLRGQGGEEITIAAVDAGGSTRVRGSTLLFDHALDRFLSSLPPAPETSS